MIASNVWRTTFFIITTLVMVGCIDDDSSDGQADAQDTVEPRIVSAGSVDATTILLTFNEAMQGGESSVENPSHYRISADNSVAQQFPAAEVIVHKAELLLPERTTVKLTTYSQSSIRYLLTVTNVTDLAGNVLKAPEGSDAVINPSQTSFTGTESSGATVVDTDEDGLSDADEQRGWNVTVVTASGEISVIATTSDPRQADTDADGINDNEEKHGSINPRSADTDGDTISDFDEWNTVFSDPTKMDTDGDGAQDGFEYYTFKTSPILADTDGDQISDMDEVAAGNRNPLLADLPRPRIDVGLVNMQLDTRFTYTDETGQTRTNVDAVETSLTKSTNSKFASSNENSTKKMLEFSQKITSKFSSGGSGAQVFPGVEVTLEAGFQQNYEQGSTFTMSEESGRSAEDQYNQSLSSTVTASATESVTRDVVAGALKVSVSIDNMGDIPFSISNLELSAQTQDPNDRRQLIPVASMVPENVSQAEINVGSLGANSRGPFVFTAVDVFPEQVAELMKNPRGLIVQLANYDLVDEAGRNFAFSSQEVTDRTAGINFDLGDGRVENYRVATASAHDSRNGRPLGISMAYALNGIIGLQRYATIRDGGNGRSETIASGDDQQIELVNSTVEAGVVLIMAGENGVLDSTPGGDDQLTQADYATTPHNLVDTIIDGGNGVVETLVAADDIQELPLDATIKKDQLIATAGSNGILDTLPSGDDFIVAAPQPYEVLSRYRDVESDSTAKQFWVLFSNKQSTATDLNDLTLRAGEQYEFAFVKDQDNDGVWAREEYLHGSSDLLPDSDGDGLSDRVEIQDGWTVQVKGSLHKIRIYPNPNQSDSDRDALSDADERACDLDARQRDTDMDGLTDWEELYGRRLVDGGGDVVMSITNAGIVTNIFPYAGCGDGATPGANGCVDGLVPHENIAACDSALSITGFATDPLNPDTDGDLIPDGQELILNINPNDSSDGPMFLDDDGDGVSNKTEIEGFITRVNGVDHRFYSDPNDPDSDADGLPDLLEHVMGSNPKNADTDNDTLLDQHEYKGENTCITDKTIATGLPCVNFGRTQEYTSFISDCAAATTCVYDAAQYTNGWGTSLTHRHTDRDVLADNLEIYGVYEVTINGYILNLGNSNPLGPSETYSDPLKQDTDGDGLGDHFESIIGLNPRSVDTDGDGTWDNIERNRGRNPAEMDARIQVTYLDFYTGGGTCDSGNGDFFWRMAESHIDAGTTNEVASLLASGNRSTDKNKTLPINASTSFVVRYGDYFRLHGYFEERDGGNRDKGFDWNEQVTVNQDIQENYSYAWYGNPSNCSKGWRVRASVSVD